MDQADIPALLARLASDEDAARKMAVFKLQSSINDPAFADVFISSGGLIILRRLIMSTGGNTLAYSLQSLSRLLEVDMGWDIFEGPAASDLVERIVELIVTNPLVNILRGAMSILVALVGHSQSGSRPVPRTPGAYGLRALKPAVAVYPQFFELVIQQLQSADHALCANALMLINALIRDAISSDSAPPTPKGAVPVPGEEWSKFIKRLQDLGLIKAVYNLMQSSALQDLAHPLLEFQSLTKSLLKRWHDVRVDLERPEHRRALKSLHLASAPDRPNTNGMTKDDTAEAKKGSRRHNPEKWRRLGFETESPAQEFEVTGFLGMMDLTDYVRKNEDGFQKLLLEQSARPLRERCPVARASLAVTMTLYEQFEVDKVEFEDPRGHQLSDDIKSNDKLFRPLLLQWSRLHTAGLHAFFRIWKSTMAEQNDFEKVAELVRILIEQVLGQATRAKDALEVEDELAEYDYTRLRELQMDLLEMSFEDNWGQHLYQVRDELKNEALQFVKEQRIRCLLEGSWFFRPTPNRAAGGVGQETENSVVKRKTFTLTPWRFARLSHNKRFLHYADFAEQVNADPALESLTEKIDLSTISSVVSNVSAPNEDARSASSNATAKTPSAPNNRPTTKITVYSFTNPGDDGGDEEKPILTLYPTSHSLASEWLDGLLMLLNQAPITSETNKLVHLVSEYGFKIRMLNVKFEAAYNGPPVGAGEVPSRAGLDEDYYYEV
ncbi:related to ELMO2 protein [Cephalotrichum gorgonifer]|uniref:Related to ELMO2 protein n=1 Tax=Cephalotrichum gorgonifer TaxID=2041049 RepID=A0AAE8SR18_9PEZI|nr:related to ELMO2 protein [Cephalotrichum gorgonifer]